MIARNSIAKVTVVVVVLFSASTSCWAQQYTRQGTVVGGATGAVIGGLIGKQTDKTTGGALIGGAIGAVAGGMMGKSYDNNLARQQYAHQHAMQIQQQQFYSQQYAAAQSGVSMADVISMGRSGVSESVIMSQLHARGVQRRLEVSDIIALHQQGVSDTVISAMQSAPLASQMGATPNVAPAQPIIIQQPPVIYREHPVYYGGPTVIYEHYRAYPVYRHRGISMGF